MLDSTDNKTDVLLKELGEDLGVSLKIDERGQCLLVLDNHLMISIHAMENSWILYGMLGEFYNSPDIAFYQYLLSLNQLLAEKGHGALAFDSKNSAVIYIHHIDLQNADRHFVYDALGAFADWLEILVKRFNESEIGIRKATSLAFQSDSSGLHRRLS